MPINLVPVGRGVAALVCLILLHACASHPPKTPAAVPIASKPAPPAGANASMVLPESDGRGGFKTANSGISEIEAVWHVRSALNVAALACNDRTVIADYNALLKRQKAIFATAYEAEARRFQSSDGAAWRSAMDSHMTRLYNYFAQPTLQKRFCTAAGSVAVDARTIASHDFQRFSMLAIGRLDQPFQSFYQNYSAYRRDLAAWRAGGDREGQAAVAQAAKEEAPSNVAPWRVQLGAFSGREAAQSAWAVVRTRAPGLASFKPHFEDASVKGLVRLQVGPVTDRNEAVRLCAAAAVAALDCLPVSPSP
jgi:hypothetical protein